MNPKYEEALKKVYSKTPKDNFLIIEFDYKNNVLLPYDEGIKFLGCLKQAELYQEPYGKAKAIVPFDEATFKTRILSRKEYEDIKVASLLGVTLDELRESEKYAVTT